jgi:hypothetical protein
VPFGAARTRDLYRRRRELRILKGAVVRQRTISLVFFVVAIFFGGTAHAVEVEGVQFEEKMRLEGGDQELVLNGAGVRTKFMMKVYAIGLYLPEKIHHSDGVLGLKAPKRVLISILMREITSDQFMNALREKLSSDLTPDEMKAMQASLGQVNEIMQSVKTLRKGQVVSLDFMPGLGTRVVVNGEVRGKYIPGDDFYRALLSGWIGDKPVSDKLKLALLGHG